jgi:hypothetical protein
VLEGNYDGDLFFQNGSNYRRRLTPFHFQGKGRDRVVVAVKKVLHIETLTTNPSNIENLEYHAFIAVRLSAASMSP